MANISPGQDSSAKEHATILIFGASGDLTARKLMPALYALWKNGYVSDECPIVGVARREKTDDGFREEMQQAVLNSGNCGPVTPEDWTRFAERLFYREADLTNPADFLRLRQEVEAIEEISNLSRCRLAYLATAPTLFLPAVQGLAHAEMIPSPEADRWLRVVIEKPFGRDLTSAQELAHDLGQLLDESQIYRIDHYLGKETVQNILLFRFGNAIFEPLFNRNHVDHVQISVAESQGIEHGRGGYYDKSGALRDVLQNHVLQLLCLMAMEPPALFRGQYIRDEKVKVLEALAPGAAKLNDWAIAGQYTAGVMNGEPVVGYRQEDRVAPDSRRETFVAMDVRIENWRWAGVPFYLRTGKRLPHAGHRNRGAIQRAAQASVYDGGMRRRHLRPRAGPPEHPDLPHSTQRSDLADVLHQTPRHAVSNPAGDDGFRLRIRLPTQPAGSLRTLAARSPAGRFHVVHAQR